MKKMVFLSLALTLSFLISTSTTGSENKILRVGSKITAPPFMFLDTSGNGIEVRGLGVDLILLLGRLMHREVSFVPFMDLDQGRQWLREDRIDMILFDSPQLQGFPEFDYIPSDISLKRRLFVNENCRGVVCLRDLDERRVVIVTGDRMWEDSFLAPPVKMIVVKTPEKALELLNNGSADVYIAPSERVAEFYIAKNRLQHVKKVGLVLEEIPIYYTIKKDDSQLKMGLENGMVRLRRHGTLDIIKEKWFGMEYTQTIPKEYIRVILIIVAVGLALLLFVMIWNQQLKFKVRTITRDLEGSERNFRALIEFSPDMIFVLDRQSWISHANSMARTIMPVSDGEKTTSFMDLVADGDKESGTLFVKSVFEEGKAFTEMNFVNPKGNILEVDVAASRVMDFISHDERVCLFARDVTELNSIERELIHADRLVTIGKMAAGIAHEINNPVGIILANVELILSRRIPFDESQPLLDAIRRNAMRAGSITRDLLATARPRVTKMKALLLHDLVISTLSMLRAQIKHIELTHIPPEKKNCVWGDEGLLQQVLVNIILNVRTALSDTDNPRLNIWYSCPDQEEIIRLFVEDNGRGIPRSQLNEIFEPFYTTDKVEGFGLGLFISRRIIEQHGGVVYAESEEKKRTLMVIELPIHSGKTACQ